MSVTPGPWRVKRERDPGLHRPGGGHGYTYAVIGTGEKPWVATGMSRANAHEIARLFNETHTAPEYEGKPNETWSDDPRCVLASKHLGDHIYPTRKPIWDRIKDGEFGDHDAMRSSKGFCVPGVTVPANVKRCRSKRKVEA